MEENNMSQKQGENQGDFVTEPKQGYSQEDGNSDSGYQPNDGHPNSGYAQNSEYQSSGYVQNSEYQGSGCAQNSEYQGSSYAQGSQRQGSSYGQGSEYQNGAYQNSYYANHTSGSSYQPYGNNGNGYQPYHNMQPYPDSQLELEEPVKVSEWVLALVLMMVPCVNIIMMFVWAFSGSEKKSKSNFFKAYLIFFAIGMGLMFLFWIGIVVFAVLAS